MIETLHGFERKIAIMDGISDDDIIELINTFYIILEEEIYSNKLNMVAVVSSLKHLKETTINIEQEDNLRKQYKIIFFVLYYTLIYSLSKLKSVISELEEKCNNNQKIKEIVDTYNYYFALASVLNIDWSKEIIDYSLRKTLKKLLSGHKYISYRDIMYVLQNYYPNDFRQLICNSSMEEIETLTLKQGYIVKDYYGKYNVADASILKNNKEEFIKMFDSNQDINKNINSYLLGLQIPIDKNEKIKEHIYIILKDEETKTLFRRKFFDWIGSQKLENYNSPESPNTILKIAVATIKEFENKNIREFYFLGRKM